VSFDPERMEPGEPRLLFEQGFSFFIPVRGYDVISDGRFVTALPPTNEPQPVTEINLITNWFEELRERVRTRR